jgi:chemotaxis protein MotB
MARRKREEEHENHERWLVSYADFITLLFAFFVVMYSVSRVDNKRLSQAAAAIKWALHFSGTGGNAQMPIFDGPTASNAVDMGGSSMTPSQLQPDLIRRRLEKRIENLVNQKNAVGAVQVLLEGKMITVRLTASYFFDPGQAVLRPDVLPLLDAIADELVPIRRVLRVEGHTDGTPVQGSRFRDNWELSASRAATVVSYLERAHHAPPTLLIATGYAASRPIAPPEASDAHDRNRRVEIVAELGELESFRRPR